MKKLITLCTFISLFQAHAANIGDIKTYKITAGRNNSGGLVDGKITIDVNQLVGDKNITSDFYGVDSQGFAKFPSQRSVRPLAFSRIKLAGNLHSVYNFELNAYYDSYSDRVSYVSSSLERRIELIKDYNASVMMQVNMMGWQPDADRNGNVSYVKTATAHTAADQLRFVNERNNLEVKDIVMGNEPFQWDDTHGKISPSADEYITKYVAYALKLRATQESISGDAGDVKLWGPELATGWTGWQTNNKKDCVVNYNIPQNMKCTYGNGEFSEFVPYFLSELTRIENDKDLNPKGYKLLDYLTLHYYPLFRKKFNDNNSIITDSNGRQSIPFMLQSVNVWNKRDFINNFDSASPKGIAPNIVNKFSTWRNNQYPAAKLAVTEFGVDSVEQIDYHPIVRPLYLADLMARLASSGVDVFVKSFLQNGPTGSNNSWALLNNNRGSVQFNIYHLFSNNYLGTPISSTDSYGDFVNSYAIKTKDGVKVLIVNKDAKKHTTKISFSNESSKTIIDVKLAAWSLTVVSIPNKRNLKIKVQQYGAKEMRIKVDSYYSSANKNSWE